MKKTDCVLYGYRRCPHFPAVLEEVPAEQRTIRDIVRLRNRGLSLREIARHLNELGRECRGRDWNHMTVDRIVKRNSWRFEDN